jgi:lipoprotein signal peptidase
MKINIKLIKTLILFALITAMLQIFDRMAVIFLNYYLNSQLIYGLALDNKPAIALSVVILCLCAWLAVRQKINLYLIAIFAAAVISNVIDRIFYGGVVDYLGFSALFIINPADTIIVISLILAGWKLLFQSQKTMV